MTQANDMVYPGPMRGGEVTLHNQNPYSEQEGLTKREYFAAQARVDTGYSVATIERITGKKYVVWEDDPLANIKIHSLFEAILKTISADALIEALNQQNEK